jgi:DNA repair photolyase
MDLFSGVEDERRDFIGNSEVYYKNVASILTPGKGFMDTYDFTLNPYSGCSFGCTYNTPRI